MKSQVRRALAKYSGSLYNGGTHVEEMAMTGRAARQIVGCALAFAATCSVARADTLLEAVQRADVAAVRALLAAGADADARDVDGATPLLYAAHLGNRRGRTRAARRRRRSRTPRIVMASRRYTRRATLPMPR